MTGFTANPEKRAKMAADRLWFLGGWGESAGKSDRRKTEGPLLNQPTHSKGLVYLLWLALLPRVGEQEKRGEERRGGVQIGSTERGSSGDMTAAEENATSSLTLQCSLRTSRSLEGNEMNEEPVFLKGTAKLYSRDCDNIYRSLPKGR